MNRYTHRALAMLLSLAAMIFMSLTVAGPAEAAPPSADPVSVPVAGTAELTDGTVGTVTGTLDIERFANQGGTLECEGEPGKGARFKLRLPTGNASSEPRDTSPIPDSRPAR